AVGLTGAGRDGVDERAAGWAGLLPEPRQLGDFPVRVATSTPRFETTKGTRYVNADFSHTTVVASPRSTTSSWLMRMSTVPTISAIEMVRARCGGYRQTFGISRDVDQRGREEDGVDLMWSPPARKIA